MNRYPKSRKAGFTLIELLVVVAIIGILSAVVLASLGTARSRANDSKVQSQLSQIRASAEIYALNNNNYGPVANSCTASGSMFVDTSSGMSRLTTVGNYPTGTTLVCNSSTSSYAVQATLSTGSAWCVDSLGVSKPISAISNNATVCP